MIPGKIRPIVIGIFRHDGRLLVLEGIKGFLEP